MEHNFGLEHPDTAQPLNNLAALYDRQGRYREAAPLYKRALTIFEKQLGANHPLTHMARENYEGLLSDMRGVGETSIRNEQELTSSEWQSNDAQTHSSYRDKAKHDTFTEGALSVLSRAQEEAHNFQHHYLGTEHLLLGLACENEGIAAQVLSSLGVKQENIRSAVEFIIGRGDRIVLGELDITPRAQKVIGLAVEEALR